MIAVSAVGAASGPMDKGFPADRIACIARNADIRLALTTRALAPGLVDAGCRVTCLDREADEIAARPASLARGVPDAADARARVISTAGSTGRPKGVAVNHCSICNVLRVAAATCGLRAGRASTRE